ncbi:acyltransferase family protein [Pseudoduganella sp. FT93W]|uniref:Acyltransferase family protein n=1 Tax=Duganella fentianensis TaxID=2692177 RepID=A0A845HYN1_9BURK|nr:acyltransferase family protein [Duganella fentianensis]MYN44006.1 acyltransferase family protein [Duganella fentianensis]
MDPEKQPLVPEGASELNLTYRSDIDGLRALAVLAVVLYHAFPTLLPGGFAGVDIFFVISGFLIGGILLDGIARGGFSFAEFYARRVRRIFPALLIVMSACLAFGWFSLFPDEYKMLAKHVLGGAGFVSNYVLWNEVGYFDTAAETKPLLHLWSLAIEEQFYIVFPALLLLARRRPMLLVLGMALVSFALNVGGVSHYASATFYSPASRLWELLLGTMLAYQLRQRKDPSSTSVAGERTQRALGSSGPSALQSILGLVLLAGAMLVLRAERHFPGWWALLPTLGALLVISAGPQAWCNRVLLSNRLMVGVGLISYPLYLWHWPLLAFARIVESGLPSVRIRVVAVLAALGLAWLTWFMLERPMRRPRYGRRKVGALCAAMLLLAPGAGLLYRYDGLPTRASVVDSARQQQDLIFTPDYRNAEVCMARYGFVGALQYCQLDQPQQAPTVLLLGDSHAGHLVDGLRSYYRSRGENLWYLQTRLPFVGVPPGDDILQKETIRMMELALHTPGIRTVILSTAYKLAPSTATGRVAYDALRNTLRQFLAQGKQVVFVNDVPALDFDPRACLRRAGVASSQTRTDCAIPRSQFEHNVAEHAAALRAVLKEFPAVQLFDSAAPLCDAERCHAMLGQTLMYRDTHHLSASGDAYMAKQYARQLEARATGAYLP